HGLTFPGPVAAAGLLALLSLLLALLSLLPLLLGHHVAKRAHPFAHGLDGIGLALQRAAGIAVAQCLFGILHRAACLVQLTARLITAGRSLAGQQALLLAQFIAQLLLALGQTFRIGRRLAHLPLAELILHVAERLVRQLLLFAQ